MRAAREPLASVIGFAQPSRRGVAIGAAPMEGHMTAFNIVRFRVKPGCEQAFIDAHKVPDPGFKGFRGGSLVKTGDRTFCMVGEWTSFQKLADARPKMIGMLDRMREYLEDLGGGLGLTDPVSGETVVALKPAKKKARPAAKKKARKAKTKKR
jgi:hypothetical protein